MAAAPEIRIDELTGLRVIVAPGRADRPESFDPTPAEPHAEAAARCPFCEGREVRTPPELWADRPGGGGPDTPGWLVRAVPNLYPALGVDGGAAGAVESGLASSVDPLRTSARGSEPDLFARVPAEGAHEVIVNGPEHDTRLLDLSEAQFATAVSGWRERMRAHADRAAYVQLIVNEGPEAGASLEHSHAQLYALGFVPADVARERERSIAYNQRTMGATLLEDVAVAEVRRRERLVAIDDEALLVCPWASRSPYRMRVIPRRPAPSFETDEAGAAMLRRAFDALAALFDPMPQLNLWIRTAPRGAEAFCWYAEIAPRLTIRAGFEFGTGVDIASYSPELAADQLREALGA